MGATAGGQAPDYGQAQQAQGMMGAGGGPKGGGSMQPPQYGGQMMGNLQNMMQASQGAQQSFAPGSMAGGDPMDAQRAQAMQQQNFAGSAGMAMAPGGGAYGNTPGQQGMQNQQQAALGSMAGGDPMMAQRAQAMQGQLGALGGMAQAPGGGAIGNLPAQQGMANAAAANAAAANAAGGANKRAMQKPMPTAAPAPAAPAGGIMGARRDARLQQQAMRAQALRGG